MKDFQIEGFKKTLDPATVAYLEERLEKSAQLGLKRITEKAANDLRQLENEAAYDYLKIEGETRQLVSEIEKADRVLGSLESLLSNFRQNLSVIKAEMTSLQDKSMTMNIELENRKNISSEFSEFIESIMLEPKLIEDILRGEVNDEYRNNIQRLFRKLANLKRFSGSENRSVKEIEPELGKLKTKACERLKTYLTSSIGALKKPNTNFQIIQKNMEPDRIFAYFLKEHAPDAYLEVCQGYSKLLSKIYVNNLKIYIGDLSKLLDEKYAQKLVLFPDNAVAYSQAPFALEDRTNVLASQQPLLIAHFESKQQRKLPLEQIFRALNELLVSSALEEYGFCQRFFHFLDEEAAMFFLTVFKPAVMLVLERVKAWLASCQDPFALLLIDCLVGQTREQLKTRNFTALTYYLEQLDVTLLPRLSEIFANFSKDLSSANPRALRNIVETPGVGEEVFMARIANFTTGCNTIAHHLRAGSFPLAAKVAGLVEQAVTLLLRISKELLIEKEEAALSINLLEVLARELQRADSLPQELSYAVKSKQIAVTAKLVEKLIDEYFPRLSRFVAGPRSQVNLKDVEETSKDFYENWKLKMANMKNEMDNKFGKKHDISNRNLKQVVARLLEIYQEFFNIVKSSYPSYTSNMYPIHKLSLDINSIVHI